jgi:biotin carboxyl carrier protein
MEEKKAYKSLTIESTKYRTLLNKKFENRKKWVKPNPKQILSYLPGTILEIYVEKGDDVEEGTPLFILEAMKMRNKVFSHMTGKIKDLNITLGEIIPKNKVLVEFE